MKAASPSPGFRWLAVHEPDGQLCEWWVSDDNLARHLDFALRRRDRQAQHDQHDQLAGVDGFQHPDARTIRPRWAGEVFDLHACVQALFTIKLPEQRNKINKPHSQAGGHRNGDGQHIGHADNTAAGSEDTSDNT